MTEAQEKVLEHFAYVTVHYGSFILWRNLR